MFKGLWRMEKELTNVKRDLKKLSNDSRPYIKKIFIKWVKYVEISAFYGCNGYISCHIT